MTKEQLRQECIRLFECKTIHDSSDLLDIYVEFLLKAIINHHKEPVNSQADADAKIIAQMMMTKALHLKDTIKGISFNAKNGSGLNKIIDPTIVASLIRNIYETTAMFNLIYINTKTKDEKKIIYLLWVIAGLKYRQRFMSSIITEEGKTKSESEKVEIEKLIKEIESNELYNNLTEVNRDKIKTKIKKKDFLLQFEANEVKFLHWHELTSIMGIKRGLLDNIYTYFSLYAHPSNVAVFQFTDMFQKETAAFPELTTFNLRVAFFMFSIFISDFIKLFPNVRKTYESLELRDQIVINFHNNISRGYEYSINDSWKACE